MTSTITYHCGDVRDVMATLEPGSVDLVVTSPPFLCLRSYLPSDHPDKHREIGSEATPAAFLDTMLGLTADWRRLLAPHGSIAVEIGDTYSGSGGAGGDYGDGGLRADQPKFRQVGSREHRPERDGTSADGGDRLVPPNGGPGWPLAKSLCGIPTLYTWSLAYARNLLTGDASPAGSWRIRNLLTWTRPNPPVGALGDKFRPATSFVTVACVSDKRWFDLDAVRTQLTAPGRTQVVAGARVAPSRFGEREVAGRMMEQNAAGAPPLDWWDANDWQPLHRLTTQPYAGSHYAAFPVALPQRLIEAMCPREVCGDCGEPRRRIINGRHLHGSDSELAEHIKDARQASGYSRRKLAEHFPHYKNADSITAQFSNWELGKNIPGRQDWMILRETINVDDRFTPFIEHNASIVEYETDGRTLAPEERDSTGYRRGGFGSIEGGKAVAAARIAPDIWTDCGHDAYRPGIVLDPFGGSATTAVAAALAGRDAVLIDIDRRNVDLARQRISEQLRIVDEHHDGDTWTWTVETALPHQTRQTVGQASIFDALDGGAA